MRTRFLTILLLFLFFAGCEKDEPQVNEKETIQLQEQTVDTTSTFTLESQKFKTEGRSGVTTSSLQTFVITFPSLSDFILNKRNTQIIGPNYDNELTYIYFPGDNTVEISHDALGAFEGVFTIRIWTDMLASVI